MTGSHLKAAVVLAVALFMAAICVPTVSAISIVNADFETVYKTGTFTPVTTVPLSASTSGTFTNSAFFNGGAPQSYNVDIPGWTATGSGGGIENLGTPYTPTDLTNSGYIGMFDTTAASISQTLSSNISSATLYTLSFEVNRRTDQPNTGTGATDFPTFAAALTAGGVPLVPTGPVSYTAPAAGASNTYTISFDSGQAFNALQSGALGITISVATGQVNIDNVVLTPEPASISLIGLTGVGLLARRRRA